MKRDAAVAILLACAAELRRRFGISELSLFGMELKFELEDRLGKRVDSVTRSGLKPRAREYVEREALRVA